MLNQVVQPVKQGSSGWGKAGSLLGLLGAGTAAALTGGTTLLAGLGAAGTGASVGGLLGGLKKGSQPTQSGGLQPAGMDSAMQRKQQAMDTQNKLTQLRESAVATAELPPEQRQQYLDPIMKAAGYLKQQQVA
jgi:hypothetical protein